MSSVESGGRVFAPARGRGRSAVLSGVLLAPKASLGGAVEDAALADHSSALLKLPVERWRKTRISTENSAFLTLCCFLSITRAPGSFPAFWKGPGSVRPEFIQSVCKFSN